MKTTSHLAMTLCGWMLIAFPTVSLAADVSTSARELAELRHEVEELAEELELEKEAHRSELRSLEMKRTELEARIRQEERRLEELETLAARQREVLGDTQMTSEHLTPALTKGLDVIRDAIRGGLPYRQQERLDAVEELRVKLTDATVDPRRLAGRIWQILEDELRLGRENVVDRQVIDLNGEDVLVQVARLGMIAIYFQTEDGKAGMAIREADAWRWSSTSGAQQEQILELFDALGKQVRMGWFDIPMIVSEVQP
jgi:hypothetical protein